MANRNRIFSYILKMVPNWNDAEDIMQNTSSIIWKKIDHYHDGQDFAAWACGIARYEILAFFRKTKNSRLVFDEDLVDQIEQNTDDNGGSHIEEISQAARDCVKKLNGKDQKIIQLRYDEELSVKQISSRLSRSVRGLYKSLARIHDNLLNCVELTIASQEHH